MKEYTKIYDIQEFKKRIEKDIEIIKKIDSNYYITIDDANEEENENYIYLHINYISVLGIEHTQLKYNTIDVISDYIKGIKDTLLIQEDKNI